MLAIVLIAYCAPIEDVDRVTPAHRAYLASLHRLGKLVASGPFVPRTGGALLLSVDSAEELAAVLRDDPFVREGIAQHDARVWAPTIGAEAIAELVARLEAT